MGGVKILASATADNGDVVRVTGEAYTGAKVVPGNIGWPMVFNSAGMKRPKSVPLLSGHRNLPEFKIGDVASQHIDGSIFVDGQIDAPTGAAKAIRVQGKNGKWQLSVGITALKIEEVKAGESRKVNGAVHEGPFDLVSKSILNEVTVIPVGADAGSSLKVHACYIAASAGGRSMRFKEWLEAKGIDASEKSADELTVLQAQYDAEIKASAPILAPRVESKIEVRAEQPDIAAAAALVVKAERERVAGIRAVCAGEYPEIEAAAMASETTVNDVRVSVLKAMRAGRPSGINTANTSADRGNLIEAAFSSAMGVPNLEARFDEKTLKAARKQFGTSFGIQAALLETARLNGYNGHEYRITAGNLSEVLHYAFPTRIEAGFSTMNIGTVLSNTANMRLLSAFNGVEKSWERICTKSNVTDFKTVTGVRLTGALKFLQVGADGMIKHGTLADESYTNRARTYARMLSITREDIINDSVKALTDVPARLGRGAALALKELFWTEFLSTAVGGDGFQFFSTDHNNYVTGANNVMGVDGLSATFLKFRQQVDPDGQKLGIAPAILLYPPELEVTALQLRNSTEIRDTTASTKYPTFNPWSGKFEPVVSSDLSDSTIPGYSTTAFYLLANPADLATMEVVFLNGVETPTIETAEADFNTLGIQARGFFDVGVAKTEYRAGVKNKGAAA